jgi:hypothetical protein
VQPKFAPTHLLSNLIHYLFLLKKEVQIKRNCPRIKNAKNGETGFNLVTLDKANPGLLKAVLFDVHNI